MHVLKDLLKLLLPIALASAVLTAEAQDSGLYFNPERDGEGINLIRNGEHIVVYMFTYQDSTGCWNIETPEGGLVSEETCGEQRWFLFSDEMNDADTVSGLIYIAVGLDYPNCLPTSDPFIRQCGEVHPVGQYIMARYNNGWRLIINRLGGVLPSDDYIFNTVFEFTTPLFKAVD